MRWLWLLALCACGAEVPAGGVVRDADAAHSARIYEPQDLIPSDLELVVRVDLSKVRQSLGEDASRELMAQALGDHGGDALLGRALRDAEVVWLGLRVADVDTGDRVTVIRTLLKRKPEPMVPSSLDWKKSETAFEDLTRYEARAAPVRGGTAHIYTFGPATGADRSLVFVSPVETMSVARVLARGPDAARGQPEARGLLSLDYRTRPLSSALAQRFPSLSALWSGILRVTATVDVTGQQLVLDGRIRCKSGGAAEKAQRFLETIRDATAARGDHLAPLMEGLGLQREGTMLAVRWTMSPEVVRALLGPAEAPLPEAPPPEAPSPEAPPPADPAP